MQKIRTIPELKEKRVQSFWSKITIPENKDLCWEWESGVDKDGYGVFSIDRGGYRAHRVSYFLSIEIDPMGLLVCHKCDNPACCNPAHLFLGTARENMEDCKSKGRYITGEKNGMVKHPDLVLKGITHYKSKFTESDIIDIRDTFSKKELNQRKLASKYSVSEHTIYCILKGITWKHLLNKTA